MGIDKKKFEALRKEFGNVASWAIWDDVGSTPKSNMRNVSMLQDNSICEILNPKYVFVALNGSGVHDGYMDDDKDWFNFHSNNPRGHDYKLRYALKGTPCWGAYITDVIKHFPEVDSTKVWTYLKQHPEIVKENIEILKRELSYLEDKPILIALGNKVYDILNNEFGKEYEIRSIKHYSYTISKENYREEFLKIMNSSTEEENR